MHTHDGIHSERELSIRQRPAQHFNGRARNHTGCCNKQPTTDGWTRLVETTQRPSMLIFSLSASRCVCPAASARARMRFAFAVWSEKSNKVDGIISLWRNEHCWLQGCMAAGLTRCRQRTRHRPHFRPSVSDSNAIFLVYSPIETLSAKPVNFEMRDKAMFMPIRVCWYSTLRYLEHAIFRLHIN